MATQHHNKLAASIMRRVYAVWFLKKFTSPLFVKFYVFFALAYGLVAQVSVGNVFANAPGFTAVGRNIRFFQNAFFNTEATVQMLVIALFGVVVWLVGEQIMRRRMFVHTGNRMWSSV